MCGNADDPGFQKLSVTDIMVYFDNCKKVVFIFRELACFCQTEVGFFCHVQVCGYLEDLFAGGGGGVERFLRLCSTCHSLTGNPHMVVMGVLPGVFWS